MWGVSQHCICMRFFGNPPELYNPTESNKGARSVAFRIMYWRFFGEFLLTRGVGIGLTCATI